VGIHEFVAGQYFFTYVDQQSVLAYGYSGSLGVGVRTTGTFIHPEEYALFCGLLGLFLMLYWKERPRPRLSILFAFLGLTACGLSGLRGILIPLMFITIYLFIRQGPHFIGRFAGVSAVTAVLLFAVNVVFHPLSNPILQERLSNSDNVYARLAAYKSAIGIFSDHPLFGVGYGGYTQIALDPQYHMQFNGIDSVPFPHNTFLAVLAETGLLGLTLYLWLWIAILRTTQNGVNRAERQFAWPLILLFLLSGLSLNLGAEPASVGATLVLAGAAMSQMRDRSLQTDDELRFVRTNEKSVKWRTYAVPKSG
jgi:O-antigen ligase